MDGEDTGAEAQIDNGADVAQEYQATPYDDMARSMGWLPPDQYKGKTNFRSAEDYIKAAVNGTKELRRDFKSLKETMDRVVKTQSVATDRAVAAERARLEAQYEALVADGDAKGARAVDREISRLDARPEKVDYETSFTERNPWYGKDEEATAYAVSISQREAHKGRSPEEQLEAAEKAVRKRFPELYDDAEEEERPARKAPSVSAPNSRASSLAPRAKGFADLPEDAKRSWAQFDKDFKARGMKDGYPKDEYVKDYYASLGE